MRRTNTRNLFNNKKLCSEIQNAIKSVTDRIEWESNLNLDAWDKEKGPCPVFKIDAIYVLKRGFVPLETYYAGETDEKKIKRKYTTSLMCYLNKNSSTLYVISDFKIKLKKVQ